MSATAPFQRHCLPIRASRLRVCLLTLRFDATRSKILCSSPILKITREDIPPIDTNTTHDPVVNISSSQNHASGRRGSRSLSLSRRIYNHISRATEGTEGLLVVATISMSLGVGAADDMESKSRCHLTTRRYSENPTRHCLVAAQTKCS